MSIEEMMNKEICLDQLNKIIEELQMIHRARGRNDCQMLLGALIYAKKAVENQEEKS